MEIEDTECAFSGKSAKTTEETNTPMRRPYHDQLPLSGELGDHPHCRELRAMSDLLDRLPECVQWVHEDLRTSGRTDKGREAMTAEQVLRALIVKQMNEFSYEELAFHLSDSRSYATFCRLKALGCIPRKSSLQSNMKRVRPETLERINRAIVHLAVEAKVETGTKTRTDCTVVETNIHEPKDSTLLWDCVRVLCRLMNAGAEEFGLKFQDHSRRGKRRTIGILNAKNEQQRRRLYADLIKTTRKTMTQAERIAKELDGVNCVDMMQALRATTTAAEIRRFVGLAEKVVTQTTRRVLDLEKVPASEKIVSIFEPHTDIIVKDRRATLYGHKACLATGVSGLVLDLVICEGNPADSTLAQDMAERQRDLLGRAPRQMVFDGGFASRANVSEIKAMGVVDVAFTKHVGLAVTDMTKSVWVMRKLRRFRAGVEAGISFLKRVFGFARCSWSGFASFKDYAWCSVVAANLLVLARHVLPR